MLNSELESQVRSKFKELQFSDGYIDRIVKTANEFEGVRDLIELWIKEEDVMERALTFVDILEIVEECEESQSKPGHYVLSNEDFDRVVEEINNPQEPSEALKRAWDRLMRVESRDE